MEHVVLVIHLILALAIIGLVLLQRSEGGGLGIGGGGGLGGLASPGATANALTRMTGICAFLFFCTSLILSVMAGGHGNSKSLLDRVGAAPAASVTDEAVTDEAPAATEEAPVEVPIEADEPEEEAPSVPVDE